MSPSWLFCKSGRPKEKEKILPPWWTRGLLQKVIKDSFKLENKKSQNPLVISSSTFIVVGRQWTVQCKICRHQDAAAASCICVAFLVGVATKTSTSLALVSCMIEHDFRSFLFFQLVFLFCTCSWFQVSLSCNSKIWMVNCLRLVKTAKWIVESKKKEAEKLCKPSGKLSKFVHQSLTVKRRTTKKVVPPVRIELTTFRLWDWRAAYCAKEACPMKSKLLSYTFSLAFTGFTEVWTVT